MLRWLTPSSAPVRSTSPGPRRTRFTRRPRCARRENRDQSIALVHLEQVERDGVATVRVLPFGAGAYPRRGTFTMVELADDDDPDLVCVEGAGTAKYLDKADDWAAYETVWKVLTDTSATRKGRASRCGGTATGSRSGTRRTGAPGRSCASPGSSGPLRFPEGAVGRRPPVIRPEAHERRAPGCRGRSSSRRGCCAATGGPRRQDGFAMSGGRCPTGLPVGRAERARRLAVRECFRDGAREVRVRVRVGGRNGACPLGSAGSTRASRS